MVVVVVDSGCGDGLVPVCGGGMEGLGDASVVSVGLESCRDEVWTPRACGGKPGGGDLSRMELVTATCARGEVGLWSIGEMVGLDKRAGHIDGNG